MKLQILIVLLVFIWGILLYSQINENQQNNELREEKSSLTSNFSYKEAENLLSSPVMEENHIMINESLVSINESLKSLEKITSNLSLIPTNINYTFPSFLNNENNSSLKIAKSDIELYTSKYQQLSNKANYITELAFKSIKNSSELFNELQKEMIKLQSEFEKVLKDLCLPLILNEKLNDYNSTNKTRNLFAIEPIYRDNINELGLLMNDGFSFCKSSFDNLGNITEEIYVYAKLVETQTKEATSSYEEILNTINDTNLHDKLISSKKSFTELKSKIEESQKEFEAEYQTFENIYYNNTINLEEFNKNYNEIAGNIKTIHGEIIDKISKEEKENDQFKVYKNDLYIPPLISYDLINKIGVLEKQLIDSQKEIKKGIEEMKNITNVEAITSLDLLFIIDITYSMDFYLEEAKKNIINIINGIISGCPGIDINLGFIGYRDFEEFEVGNYTDIDFTQNYTYVQKVIEGVWADGGGDLAEDIAGAFEMALNKTWKSNARFAMLIADAPCHGKICYYGYYNDDYPNGVPGQRNITDIVEELAENKISLFCLRILGDTERMFNMFKSIYKKHKNIGFNIFSKTDIEQDFIDLIVESASEVYENQRYIDDENSHLKQIASYIVDQLFGITFDFSLTFFDKTIIVWSNPKITVSISESCSIGLEDEGYIQMQNGLSFGQKGIEPSFDFVFKYLEDTFNVTMDIFQYRFDNLIINGKIYFKISENGLTFIFLISSSEDYFNCEGSISITIEKNYPIPEPSLVKEKDLNEVIIEKKLKDALEKLKKPEPLVIIGVIVIIIFIVLGIQYLPAILPILPALA